MEPMVVDGDEFERSITFDTSRRNDLKVTVGVELYRDREPELLDTLCRLQGEQYRPFRTKSRDLDLGVVPKRRLIEACPGRIAVALHDGRPDKLALVEAVHSALLYDRLRPFGPEALVVTDGAERRAKLFAGAVSAIDVGPVTPVACQQSEWYYPHAYLADVLAGAIGKYYTESEPFPRESFDAVVVTTNGTHDGGWNRAYRALARRKTFENVPTYRRRRSESPSERIGCWFRGEFGAADGERPDTDSTQHVVNWLDERGYETAATQLQ
jgi:hypothetical protein